MNHKTFLMSLENGSLRVAHNDSSAWTVNTDVKQKILDIFKNTDVMDMPGGFRDKAPLTIRNFTADDRVRTVPGGTSVRAGAYIGQNVVIMPPSYINIGAYVDDDSMIDSHVLVGSCAQIGKRVHLSAGVQIGGVLEPVGHRPVIIEDDAFIGAGAILVEGVLIRERAVIAPGVILSATVPIYDLVNKTIIKGEIPTDAVVVPGTRPISGNHWATEQALQLGCAMIIKYRDAKTNTSLVLEEALR